VSPLVRQRHFHTCRNANNIKNETLRARKAVDEPTTPDQIGSVGGLVRISHVPGWIAGQNNSSLQSIERGAQHGLIRSI
jgi:hypothetical protein